MINDRLAQIVEMQDTLNSRFGKGQQDMIQGSGLPYNPDMVNKFADATIAELIELKEALPVGHSFKYWKDKSKDYAGLKEEGTDAFFFTLSILLSLGMTADDIFDEYKKKYDKNNVRSDWEINRS